MDFLQSALEIKLTADAAKIGNNANRDHAQYLIAVATDNAGQTIKDEHLSKDEYPRLFKGSLVDMLCNEPSVSTIAWFAHRGVKA